MKNIFLALLSLAVLAPLTAPAKPYHLTSVRWIVETRNNIDVDDHYVTIVGHVTRRISDEEYWFTDSTGQIRLDSENFDLPIGKRIVVGGRIDQAYLGFGHVEVDVRHWHYAPLPGKTVAVVHSPVTHIGTPASASHPAAPASVSAPASTPAPVVTTAPPAVTPAPVTTAAPPAAQAGPATNSSPLTPPAETH